MHLSSVTYSFLRSTLPFVSSAWLFSHALTTYTHPLSVFDTADEFLFYFFLCHSSPPQTGLCVSLLWAHLIGGELYLIQCIFGIFTGHWGACKKQQTLPLGSRLG
ncbi:unnamed protein product [Choristocarpus tenellus]